MSTVCTFDKDANGDTEHTYTYSVQTKIQITSCEPVNIQIKYGACYLTTPNRLGIAGMTLEPNKERQNS